MSIAENRLYDAKEQARTALEEALSDYDIAARAYFGTREELVEELNSCLENAGISDLRVDENI